MEPDITSLMMVLVTVVSTLVYVTVDKAFHNVALLLHFHKYLKQIIHNITYDLHCENIDLL